MSLQCPNCGKSLRPGARFCLACGQAIAQPPVAPQPPAPSPQQPAAPRQHAPSSPPPYSPPGGQPAAHPARPTAGPAAAAGSAMWRASKKGMGWFARLVTLGGRAAYTEIFRPPSVAEGQVVTQGAQTPTPAPVELGAILFVLAFALWPLVFLVQDGRLALVAFVGVLVGLLALNFAGVRWPAFSKLTFGRLFGRYPGGRVPEMQFQVHDAQKGVINVRIVGVPRQNVQIAPGHLTRVYGLPQPGRNEIRAWKAEVYSASGQPQGILTVPRLLPLFAMWFFPTLLWFLVWIVLQFVQRSPS